MSKVTSKLGLILPGGGSTGLNMPPDRVDIDVVNNNFQKLDDFATEVGTPVQGLPGGRFRQAGVASGSFSEGGSIVAVNTEEIIVGPLTIGGSFKAGSILTMFASMQLAQSTTTSIAGRMRIRKGTTKTDPTLAERRWHNHGRAGMMFPSMYAEYIFVADEVDPKFVITVNNDPSSGGGIETWDGFYWLSVDRIK